MGRLLASPQYSLQWDPAESHHTLQREVYDHRPHDQMFLSGCLDMTAERWSMQEDSSPAVLWERMYDVMSVRSCVTGTVEFLTPETVLYKSVCMYGESIHVFFVVVVFLSWLYNNTAFWRIVQVTDSFVVSCVVRWHNPCFKEVHLLFIKIKVNT